MAIRVLVTGATGTVGSEVVRQLSATDAEIRIAARRPTSDNSRAEAVALDLDRPETFGPALDGVDKLFLLPPNLSNGEEINRFVDAAKQAGVRHIVKLSSLGIDREPQYTFGKLHKAMEQYIEASGVPYTFLRPNFFMQNYLTMPTIKEQGAIFHSLGDARTSHIDVRDIAAVAVAALTGSEHEGKRYELTGPEALSEYDVAAILSKITGRTINYVVVPEEAVRQSLQDAGTPDALVAGLMDLFAFQKAGHAAFVTSDVENVLGRKPISFEQFARDHVEAFK
ncbi:MAG TPA: SDR family oxidoreductase [Blastocatellia bacterium]|nr:SDR family oxidoreductase [Blastocatellia bacterium]